MRQYTEGEVLKALRERLQESRTQAAIARELGFSAQFLSAVIGGQRPITTALAEALGFREIPRAFVKVR